MEDWNESEIGGTKDKDLDLEGDLELINRVWSFSLWAVSSV